MSAPTPTPPAAQRLDFAEVYRQGYPVTLGRARRALSAGETSQATEATRASGRYTEPGAEGWSPEDVAQEVWLRVWRRWDTLATQPARVVYAYALRATDTLVIDLARRRATIARRGQVRMSDRLWDAGLVVWADPAADRQPEAQTLYRALVEDLRAVARMLPGAPDARHTTHGRDAALFEALLAGEEQPATARRLGLGESAVKMSAWRLRHRLCAHLRRADEADEADAV